MSIRSASRPVPRTVNTSTRPPAAPIGYMHLPDMGGDGLTRFIQFYYPQPASRASSSTIAATAEATSPMIIERLSARSGPTTSPPRRTDPYPEGTQQGSRPSPSTTGPFPTATSSPRRSSSIALGPVIGKTPWAASSESAAIKLHRRRQPTQPEFAWYDPTRVDRGKPRRGIPISISTNTPDQEAAGKGHAARPGPSPNSRIEQRRRAVQPFRLVPSRTNRASARSSPQTHHSIPTNRVASTRFFCPMRLFIHQASLSAPEPHLHALPCLVCLAASMV